MAKSNTLNPSVYISFGRLTLLSANAVKQRKDFFLPSNTNQAVYSEKGRVEISRKSKTQPPNRVSGYLIKMKTSISISKLVRTADQL